MNIDSNTRCLQIWQVPIASASNRQTVTYGEIIGALRWDVPAYGYGRRLDAIAAYCSKNQLPDLTVLMADLKTGSPGAYKGDDLNRDREAVFATNWFALPPPTREDFAKPTQ